MNPEIRIGNSRIGLDHPTYFIADIASNHGGDLEIAKKINFRSCSGGCECSKIPTF